MRKGLIIAVASLGFAAMANAQQAPVKEVKTSKAGKITPNAHKVKPKHAAMVLKPAPKPAK